MVKFLAGMFCGMLAVRLLQIHAENIAFSMEWDAFAAGIEAQRAYNTGGGE
jgi:hypothetical protein